MNLLKAKGIHCRRGFSLIELIVVMSIMAGVLSLAVPFTSNFLRSNQMNSATGKVGGLIEEARNQALARQSYMWLALKTDLVRKGTWVALFDSGKTASSDSSEMRLVTKPVFLQGITLKQVNELSSVNLPSTDESSTDDLVALEENTASGSFSPIETKIGALGTFSFDRLVLFSPRGEALARKDTVSRWIVIGLAPNSSEGTNAAVFQISGLTAQCITHRP